MCLILLAHRPDSEFPLVIAANRDEFFDRASEAAHFWPTTDGRLLAGRDSVMGGTWMGITRNGRFAAVTNIRDPSRTRVAEKSRGHLTLDYLMSDAGPEEWLHSLLPQVEEYSGFNLILGRLARRTIEMYHCNSDRKQVRPLSAGIYGLSNGDLDDPWPKVSSGKQTLQSILETDLSPTADRLLTLLTDRTEAPDSHLPDTGIPLELERRLSSRFIVNSTKDYGTRSSTVVIIERQAVGNTVRFAEQNYERDSETGSRRIFYFDIGVGS